MPDHRRTRVPAATSGAINAFGTADQSHAVFDLCQRGIGGDVPRPEREINSVTTITANAERPQTTQRCLDGFGVVMSDNRHIEA